MNKNNNKNNDIVILSSMISGAISTIIVNPLDILKIRE